MAASKLTLLCVALAAVAAVAVKPPMGHTAKAMDGCNGKPDFNPQNLNPIRTAAPVLIKSVPNGRLYNLQLSAHPNDTMLISHLYGTPYQKGFAHGQLVSDRTKKLVAALYKWLDDTVSKAINGSIGPIPYDIAVWIANTGINAALDVMSALTGPFTGPYIAEEQRGFADGSGVDVNAIRRIHMLGELTKGHCSMFGVWGNHLADKNGLLVLRAFDWVMEGPFRDYHEISVYHAQNSRENTFLNLGWSGWMADITCPGYDTVMSVQLNKYKGNLTAENAIRDVMPVVSTGDLHLYVADLPNEIFYFSVAARTDVPGPVRGFDRPFTKIDLKSQLWSVAPPTAEEIEATAHVPSM